MTLWTLIKIVATLVVVAVLAVTAMLAYHATVEPVAGIEHIVPSPRLALDPAADADLTKKLDTAQLPEIDPGEPLFKKASNLLALGHLDPARENLTTIINVFPSSAHAAEARRIVGEMNLDEILSTTHRAGKQIHTVKRGDSYLAIASKYQTTLDAILYLNGMTRLKTLQPGAELVVMPLNYRLLIEPASMALSLWDGGRFVCQYPIVHHGGLAKLASQNLTIQAKSGQLDGRAIRQAAPPAKGAKTAAGADPPAPAAAPEPPRKSLQLNRHALRITSFSPEEKDNPGVFLAPEDMEELFLLTRTGNTVEIRIPSK
jgi:LysM repeat protein